MICLLLDAGRMPGNEKRHRTGRLDSGARALFSGATERFSSSRVVASAAAVALTAGIRTPSPGSSEHHGCFRPDTTKERDMFARLRRNLPRAIALLAVA